MSLLLVRIMTCFLVQHSSCGGNKPGGDATSSFSVSWSPVQLQASLCGRDGTGAAFLRASQILHFRVIHAKNRIREKQHRGLNMDNELRGRAARLFLPGSVMTHPIQAVFQSSLSFSRPFIIAMGWLRAPVNAFPGRFPHID